MIGCSAVAVCAAPLSGCAQLFDWSAGSDQAVERTMARSDTETAPASDGAASSATSPPPDLSVTRGDDPAANVGAAVDALGGMESFVSRGARVVLKPNVLTSRAPEYAATTNPSVVGALVEMCLVAGADEVVVLDRPTAEARTAFEVSGILQATQQAGGTVKFLSDRNFEKVAIPEGRVLTEWPLVTDVFEADTFINVPIAKTHGMAGLTMAMKNLMGVMGGSRGLIHQGFDQKIVDLNTVVRPHLVVLDATRILTANGPTGGDLSDVQDARTIVAGVDQVAVDAYGATLFGQRSEDLSYLVRAAEQGLGETDLERLDIRESTV
jgi:uncharacterized protein (DUF362 family)